MRKTEKCTPPENGTRKFTDKMCFALRLLVLAMFGISSLGYAGTAREATTVKEIKQETGDLLESLKSYTVEQRDEAIRKSAAAMENLDKRIETMAESIDQNWDALDQAGQKKARAAMRELRRERTLVAEWYGSLKNGSAEAWEFMKEGFSDAYRSLQKSWEKAEQEFGPDK
jgi:hypothetical protein